jgi:hypothetical protein
VLHDHRHSGIHARPLPRPSTSSPTKRSGYRTQLFISMVLRDYYTIPYGMQLTVLANAARDGNGQIDAKAIQQALTDATMNIEVSDIKTGQTADIASSPFTDFVSVPQPDQEVILLDVLRPDGSGPYGSITAKWGQPQKEPGADLNSLTGITMQQFLEKMGDTNGTLYSWYIACTVNVSYKGRRVNYKAMYLFPAPGEDQEMQQHLDMFLQGTRYSQFAYAFRPDRILRSKWRDIPAMHDWLAAHAMPDDKCTGANAGSMCCVNGLCGLRKSDFDRRMKIPIKPLGTDAPPATPPAVQSPGPQGAVRPLSQRYELGAPTAPLTNSNAALRPRRMQSEMPMPS